MKTIIIDGVEYDLTPKALFKKGDWIVYCNEDVDLITGIEDTGYLINKGGYIPFICQGDMRLWTIQDAKDGDILTDSKPFIFKRVDVNKHSYAYCGLNTYNDFTIESEGEYGEWTWIQDIKPAPKEQRDLLFRKMKEAGYEWDAEKKELKEIEQKSVESRQETKPNGGIVYEDFNDGDGYYKVNIAYLSKSQVRLIENLVTSWQNPTNNTSEWSKEDEEHLNSILERLEGMCKKGATFTQTRFAVSEDKDWLKSLRPNLRWKPSEEQMRTLEYYMNVLNCNEHKEVLFGLYEQLKTL